MQHPNSEFIKAWADGVALEVRDKTNPNNPWLIFVQNSNTRWGPWCSCPDNWEWRIAPKKVMIRHALRGNMERNVWAYTKGFHPDDDDITQHVENRIAKGDDIKWLDEWHEAGFGPEV